MDDDTISRKAATKALERTKEKDPKGDIARFYNKIIQNDIDTIMQLPSVKPEIVRCKDCKHYIYMWYCDAWNNSPGFPAVSDDMFCSLAERREE